MSAYEVTTQKILKVKENFNDDTEIDIQVVVDPKKPTYLSTYKTIMFSNKVSVNGKPIQKISFYSETGTRTWSLKSTINDGNKMVSISTNADFIFSFFKKLDEATKIGMAQIETPGLTRGQNFTPITCFQNRDSITELVDEETGEPFERLYVSIKPNADGTITTTIALVSVELPRNTYLVSSNALTDETLYSYQQAAKKSNPKERFKYNWVKNYYGNATSVNEILNPHMRFTPSTVESIKSDFTGYSLSVATINLGKLTGKLNVGDPTFKIGLYFNRGIASELEEADDGFDNDLDAIYEEVKEKASDSVDPYEEAEADMQEPLADVDFD